MVKKKAFRCPDCGSTEFYKDPEKAELICAKCGRVLEDSRFYD